MGLSDMTQEEFWNLISTIDISALEREDEDAALQPLALALRGKDVSELEEFEEILSQKLYDIDGRAYCENCGEAGASDDSFLDMRCYVVARGKDHYEAVKADPTLMPKSFEQWCESLLYVHREAWAQATGQDAGDWEFEASVSYESASNEELWLR